MAFLIFERDVKDGHPIIRPTGETFSLAGYNLIYKIWRQKGCPIDTGWHVTADELIRLETNNAHSNANRRLVIDFDPRSTWRIGLVELLDIYAFTWGGGMNDPSEPAWTPMMLRMRDVHYREFEPPTTITPSQKQSMIENLPESSFGSSDFMEFLYLNGPRNGWNWGRNGMTNSAFLQGAARDYFRRFF